jgi:hydroxyacylglutathione hydrolase
MKLTALPAFSDNYFWTLHDGQQALVVDPGEAAPVLDWLDTQQLELTAILVTHHHPDHVGGLEGLRSRLRGPVYGPQHPAIPGPLQHVAQGDAVDWNGLHFQVLQVPGHTLSHLAYFHAAQTALGNLLFCGDTLFSGGCGRLFEGTPAQMYDSLSRLAALPGDTQVCCAHEYTLSNLRFAQAVEPHNPALARYLEACVALREQGLPTLPSSIGLERDINPFLRCDVPAVMAAARQHGAANTLPDSVLGALRQWKNNYP